MKFAKLGTVAVLTAGLMAGAAGVAGAAQPGATATGQAGQPRTHWAIERLQDLATANSLPANFNCANAPKMLAHLDKVDGKLNARIDKASVREQKLEAKGDTTKANDIATRIANAKSIETDITKVSALINQHCPQ